VSHDHRDIDSSNTSRWVLIGLSVLTVLSLSVYLIVTRAQKNLESLNEAKKARITTAVVKAKEQVHFEEKNRSYIGDYGQTVEVPSGTDRWRIYYQIDNFDQVPEPKRGELLLSEAARIKKLGFRFYHFSTPEKALYDATQVGDQLEVTYRYIGDEKEIIGVRNLTHPNG
jgi:hypothetical protein